MLFYEKAVSVNGKAFQATDTEAEYNGRLCDIPMPKYSHHNASAVESSNIYLFPLKSQDTENISILFCFIFPCK